MTNKVYVGDEGTRIELDPVCDLTGVLIKKILVKKPDGIETEWPAEVSANKLFYLTLANTLDQAGAWILQAYIENASGKWRGESAILSVFNKFT